MPQIIGVGKNYRAHIAELAAGDNPLVRRPASACDRSITAASVPSATAVRHR